MPEDDFQIDRPLAPGHLHVGVNVHFDYGLDPLVYKGAEGDGEEQTATIVGHQVGANAALSLGLGKRGLLFAGLPVTLWMDGDDPAMIGSTTLPSHDDPGLGDAYLGTRVVLFGEHDSVFALAGQLTATFPTAGKNQQFRGDEFLSLLPELLLAIRPGLGSRITLNLGGRIRDPSDDDTSNLSFGNEFTYALGFAIPMWTGANPAAHFDFHLQAFGASSFSNVEETPVEGLGGFKYFHQSGFVMGAAAGPGITRGFGSPLVRGVFMLGYQKPREYDRDGDGILDDADLCPDDPEDMDGFEDENGCPDPDNDQDGIPDGRDACPIDPETFNQVDDEDGCPDEVGDRDQDGLLDTEDECPDDPEDVDGFEDEDGCPDPDNDQDGVPDTEDRCPMEKGKASNNGCPDPDRDGDGVPDRVDNCPDKPGPAENQGCPEKQKVRIHDSGLEILEKVYFRTGRSVIQPRSFALLNNVAEVLKAHPEIERIVVEGHTDSRGPHRYNMRLSQARAESVRTHLIRQGVKSDRLQAKGFGPDRPIVPDARTKEELAQNRRVEFRIPETPENP